MSFILDALRKSESQRRLESVPEVMRVPVAVKRERVPRWALGLIAILTLALVATALVGLRGRPDPALRTAAAPAPEMSNAEMAPPPSPATASRTEAPSVAGPTVSAAPSQPLAGTGSASRTSPLSDPVTGAETAPATSAAATAPTVATAALTPERRRVFDPVTLPSATALRAAGVVIPELDLQLLVTSNTPASRFVVINGKRYREGERLLEGPELVAVTQEGAVLRHVGRDFLLVTD